MSRSTIRCEWVNEHLTAYREGWLGAEEAEKVRLHTGDCIVCQEMLRREESLVQQLTEMPMPIEQVPARRLTTGSARPSWPRLFVPAFTALAAATLVLWHVLPVPGNVQVATPAPSEAMSYATAHHEMGLGDEGLDPNRVVVLAQLARQEGER